MHALTPPRGWRPQAAVSLLAAAVGIAALGPATPAAAATTPTISAPQWRTGFGPITISGTASPGATVTLIEAAYVFRSDMKPAINYDTGEILRTKANSTGHYSIQRNLDSGFVFRVEAEGRTSRTITVSIQVLPTLTVSPAGSGTVSVSVLADPSQPGLPVQIFRVGSATAQASGSIGAAGSYSTTLTGQGTATRQYRAHVGGDPANAVLANDSNTVDSKGDEVSPAPITPPPGTPATPAPTTVTVKPGDVQFTKVVYNSPGADTGSNTSLNGEYVRLANKTKRTIDLMDWTIRDASGHVYRVSGTQPLGAGKTLYVHTGKGTNGRPDSAHRYWNRTAYIWDNGGDTAILRTGSNRTIDSCNWGAGTGTTYC